MMMFEHSYSFKVSHISKMVALRVLTRTNPYPQTLKSRYMS